MPGVGHSFVACPAVRSSAVEVGRSTCQLLARPELYFLYSRIHIAEFGALCCIFLQQMEFSLLLPFAGVFQS